MTDQPTKVYLLSSYDSNEQLVAAEFVEDLTPATIEAIERWTDQGHEFRIKRTLKTMNGAVTLTRILKND